MMRESLIRKIPRLIRQYFEIEYWYHFRKWNEYYYDEDEDKFIKSKKLARDHSISTWDGSWDILWAMRMKMEHMFHNLKHYGVHLDFYFDPYSVIKYGTNLDKLICFEWVLKAYDIIDKKKLRYVVTRRENTDGSFSNLFPIKSGEEYLAHEYKKDGTPDGWSIVTKAVNGPYLWQSLEIEDIVFSLDLDSKRDREIVEGVLTYVQTIKIPVEEFNRISKKLQDKARGLRRTLTQILHARHLVKKLTNLSDTDPKYWNMWANEGSDKQNKLLMKAEKLYLKDKKKLWHEFAEYMSEYSEGWWD